MHRRLWPVVLLTGCLDVSLPARPPPPGPGTLQGRLVYAVPGQLAPVPARSATVSVLGTSNTVTADDDGRFVLGGLRDPAGLVRMTLDLDGDGAPERQKLLALSSVGVQPGRDVSLGDVLLGRNARLTGRVLRGDLATDGFHLGTTVFITGMEFSTQSADTGGWALDALPEGPVQVTFFRTDYQAESREVVLEAGAEKRLADVRLLASPSGAATVTGEVRDLEGAPISGARVLAVAPTGEVAASSTSDGAFSLGPMPGGAWLLGVERAGYVSVSLGRRLFAPGRNALGTIVLAAGVSRPLELDAGQVTPGDAGRPDGGPSTDAGSSDSGFADAGSQDAGSPDAGSQDAGSPDAGSPDAGAPDGGAPDAGAPDAGAQDAGPDAGPLDGLDGGADAGGSDGGAPDAGPDGGGADAGLVGDAGTPLDCGGACAPGFFCTARVECQSSACGLTSCAEACNDGRCYARTCGSLTCGPGDVCEGVTCRPLSCAGVACPSTSACANGRCISQLCRYGSCGPGTVCVNADCLDTRCVDVTCAPQHDCIGGVCLPTSSQQGTTCAPGFVFLGGRCVDQRCQGVTCPAGGLCRNGQCNSTGLFVAGQLYPEGRTNLAAETVIATLGPQGWRRTNVTALPPVLQLFASADGQWLFVLTDDVVGGLEEGSLWRSADGVGWVKVFDGSSRATSGALMGAAVDYPSGALFVGLLGGPLNGLAGVLRSDDDGATWRRVVNINQDPAGGRGTITGISSSHVVVPTSTWGTIPGFYPVDGGARIPFSSTADVLLLSDPEGVGPLLVSSTDLRIFDGGVIGPAVAACHECRVFGPGASLFVVSTSSVWFSPTGASMGIRALPVTPPVSLSGIVRAADDRLVVSNRNAQPPLFASADEGLTWDQLGTDWYGNDELSDPTPSWQPDASYVGGQRVRPTRANGWLYERFGSGTGRSGGTEPTWPLDGGAVLEPNVSWRAVSRHFGLRISALTSLRCQSGRQRCGGACVEIAANPLHCGACGFTCASGLCRNGACVVTDAGLVQSGCADGTREGFIDDVAWPDVAACAGAWAGELSASADAVCGAGFHVCTPQDTELRAVRYADAVAFPGCFAYRASNDGFDGCDELVCQGDPSRDDMAGMGRTCERLSGVSRPPATIPDGGRSCLADHGRIDATCCAGSVMTPGSACRQGARDGVICCRD